MTNTDLIAAVLRSLAERPEEWQLSVVTDHGDSESCLVWQRGSLTVTVWETGTVTSHGEHTIHVRPTRNVRAAFARHPKVCQPRRGNSIAEVVAAINSQSPDVS